MIVAVDIADTQLFGEKLLPYEDRVDLCIDHHPSNICYAGACPFGRPKRRHR